MALDLNTADLSIKLPEGISLITVKTSKDFTNWIKPIAISFHMSEMGANIYKQIFEDLSTISEKIQHYVAFKDDEPVASCSFFLDTESKTVGIYNCGTTPEARKKGIVTALACHGLLAVYTNGYQTALLQASPMSKGLFEKIGFETCLPFKVYLG
jgi:predicted acetyltransferase